LKGESTGKVPIFKEVKSMVSGRFSHQSMFCTGQNQGIVSPYTGIIIPKTGWYPHHLLEKIDSEQNRSP
jgi:hypothetical protein